MRKFNKQLVELLAPASNYETIEKLLQSGCDAIYLGGKNFNMRMHSEKLNFTLEDIANTVHHAHVLNKSVYVTVNTWVDDSQLEELLVYLKELEACHVDAIVIQDLAVAKLVKEHNINLTLHASVMMNIHNLQQIKLLETLGFTRFVASRELSLNTIKHLSSNTTLEIEYFVSGDMCTVHGSQCYYSSILFNKSANQGQCFKMCRWQYQLQSDVEMTEFKHFLAAKDLDLSNDIDQLILSGVTSFKIEGRRKPISEILPIIDTFSHNIDMFISNPFYKSTPLDLTNLYPRTLSKGFAYKNPHNDYLNEKNESDPNVLRIFSSQGQEPGFNEVLTNEIKDVLGKGDSEHTLDIKVKVETLKQAKAMLKLNVHTLYISIESLSHPVMTVDEINHIIKCRKDTKIMIALPQMCTDEQIAMIDCLLNNLDDVCGLLVGDLGSLSYFKDRYEIITDFNLNVTNKLSLDVLNELGATGSVLSIELNTKHLNAILSSPVKTEMLVHGQLSVMLSEIDYYKHFNIKEEGALVDIQGIPHPLYCDHFSRTHMMSAKSLCLYPIIDNLRQLGLNAIVIDGRLLSVKQLLLVVKSYQMLNNETTLEHYYENSDIYSYHTLAHLIESPKFVITNESRV